MLKKLKKIKLFTWLKTSLFLSAICGLLSVGCLIHDKTKHVEKASAENDVSQLFSIIDTGNVNSSVTYSRNPNSSTPIYITLNFTYRYQLFGLRSNDVVNYKERVYLTYTDSMITFYASTFLILPYEQDVLPGHETMVFDTGFFSEIPDDASFYLMCFQDYDSSRSNFNAGYDISSTIQGDYWETWTINSMVVQSGLNVTDTWYSRINFPYNNGENRILLFDATSVLNSVDKEDIWYSQGFNEGYIQGYGEGYYYGEQSGNSATFNDGYSQGAYNGYQQGLADGYQNAQQSLQNYWQQGYSAGLSDGYNEGFSADSTATTIFNGILTIGMVPINIFLAMFNFEILGINLSAFIKGLLTVCVTIIVVRTIMGGKGGSDK